MNFEYIEEIVAKCKNGDKLSKEILAKEFKPFILNLSKKTFIDRYEMQDIQGDMENYLPAQNAGLEDLFCNDFDYQELKFAINNLTREEKELIDFVFYKNNTIRNYAYIKNMCYSTAAQRKNVILKKIGKALNQY